MRNSGNARHIDSRIVLTLIGVLMVNDRLTNLVNKVLTSKFCAFGAHKKQKAGQK